MSLHPNQNGGENAGPRIIFSISRDKFKRNGLHQPVDVVKKNHWKMAGIKVPRLPQLVDHY